MVYGSAFNATSQFAANGGVLGDINLMEVGFSALPGYTATVLGEGFNFSYNKWKDENIGITADFTSKQALISIGGGVFSNWYGGETDDYLENTGKLGKSVREFWKFQIETVTNIDPDIILGNKK